MSSESARNNCQLERSELEDTLQKAESPGQKRVLLQQQAIHAKNPIIYHYRPESILEKTITETIDYWATQPESLTEKSALHKSANKFYEKERNLNTVYEATFSESVNEYSQGEQRLLKNAIAFILEEYEGMWMKREGFCTAEHSLHAAQLLGKVKGVQSQDLLTALFHDLIEDKALREEDGKTKKFKTVAAEKGAITRASKRIYNTLKTGDWILDHKLRVAKEATVIMTTKSWQDYESYIDDVETKDKEIEEEVRTSTMLAKMADKQTSMMTWEPFDNSDKLKQIGKAYLVINKARDVSSFGYERSDVLEEMSTYLAGSMRRACDTEIANGLSFLEKTKRKNQRFDPDIILEPERLNRAINNGLLDKWEQGSDRAVYGSIGFAKTLHAAVVLGSHPERDWESIPPMLRTTDSERKNRNALLEEQRKYRLHHGDAKFTTGDDLEEEVARYEQKRGRAKATTRKQVGAYMRRMLGLRQLATRYAIEPEFSLGDGS